jgi:hypothetical protein
MYVLPCLPITRVQKVELSIIFVLDQIRKQTRNGALKAVHARVAASWWRTWCRTAASPGVFHTSQIMDLGFDLPGHARSWLSALGGMTYSNTRCGACACPPCGNGSDKSDTTGTQTMSKSAEYIDLSPNSDSQSGFQSFRLGIVPSR